MSLAVFIQDNKREIINEWENFARSVSLRSNYSSPLALRNHISDILDFIVADMQLPQTGHEQTQKSQGGGRQRDVAEPTAAETHAALRLAGGFNMDQMVSEYRALRASIIKLWLVTKQESDTIGLQEIIRFNESIDQQLTESIRYYTLNLNLSRNLFLGILTHDLRNPLGAVMMSAGLIAKIGPLNERQAVLAAQITDSGERIQEIVSHLLDITSSRLGSGLPVVRTKGDLGFIARQLAEEMQAQHPARKFTMEILGNTDGEWDKARMGQVFSNLMGNAHQYGFKYSSIDIIVDGRDSEVVVTVHNDGVPIAPEKIEGIFDSMVRAGDDNEFNGGETMNLGLGLFITREIIDAHDGILTVTSSEKDGTTFTARMPRVASTVTPTRHPEAY